MSIWIRYKPGWQSYKSLLATTHLNPSHRSGKHRQKLCRILQIVLLFYTFDARLSVPFWMIFLLEVNHTDDYAFYLSSYTEDDRHLTRCFSRPNTPSISSHEIRPLKLAQLHAQHTHHNRHTIMDTTQTGVAFDDSSYRKHLTAGAAGLFCWSTKGPNMMWMNEGFQWTREMEQKRARGTQSVHTKLTRVTTEELNELKNLSKALKKIRTFNLIVTGPEFWSGPKGLRDTGLS